MSDRIHIRNGRIVGTEVQSQLSGRPSDGTYQLIGKDEQPFGFTREDVEELRRYCTVTCEHSEEHLFEIADRIEALLPPKEQP